MTPEILEKITRNNKIYGHYAYLPNYQEYLDYNNSDLDLFSLKEKPAERYKFSVKDIFNTYLFPTQMGSKQWTGFKAGNNARVITDLLWRGDKLVGKTTTSEFAVHEETNVKNPLCEKRTVGTSSAGAPVSILVDGLDYALATQTGGSITRPASYTGTLAIKPSYGLIPRTGILKTCDPFDTVGFFAKDLDVMENVFNNIIKRGHNYPKSNLYNIKNSKNICILEHDKVEYSDYTISSLKELEAELKSAGCGIVRKKVPEFLIDIHLMHQKIYSYSLSYYFSKELENIEEVSKSFKETVDLGSEVSSKEFIYLLSKQNENIKKFDNWIIENNIDYLLNPTTYGIAPKLNQKDKNDLNLLFTYCHVPQINIPLWVDNEHNMPFGCTLAAKKFDDQNLIKFANFILKYKKY